MTPKQSNDDLQEYRRKRNFQVTSEPAGSEKLRSRRAKAKSKQLYFCVQKHLASHLHYDLRLEHNGVLLSWAVPKGPSLRPGDKRFAVRTEDHPIEYGDFEGVIPEGYGAGIVVLWDQGTWEPMWPDIDMALAKGELKFNLTGYKLKGSWVLVRTAKADDPKNSRNWLLLKHRDEWSGDLDITTFLSLSIKSGGDFEHILAADNPNVWRSNRAAPARGGTAGAMLAEIIEKAAKLKAEQSKKTEKGKAVKKRKKE
jgi:bifunctional non-homologous end joining protein LigD